MDAYRRVRPRPAAASGDPAPRRDTDASAPKPPEETVDKYLEAVFEERYKRQLEQEENVSRTLPFFAAALAVLANIIGLLRPSIPSFSMSVFALAVHACLAGLGFSILYSIVALWFAVRRKEFYYPTQEDEVRAYVAGLREYYASLGLSEAEIEGKIIADLRGMMIDQYARSAMHNRRINDARVTARAAAATSLMYGLGFAFGLLVIIFIHDAVYGAPNAHSSTTATGTRSSGR